MDKIVLESFQRISDKIPTRFDDITKEIIMEKSGIKAYKKLNEATEYVEYYKLGDKLGEVLNKII